MMNKICFLFIFILQLTRTFTFDDANDESVSLNFEDNIDGRFSSFSKQTIRFSRQNHFELSPSRTISLSQYDKLIDTPYYTLKVYFKRGAIQDYVMTSIPMCRVLQAEFQYSVTLFVNENGYLVGVQVQTDNSTCNLNELKKNSEYNYQVTMKLQLSEAGPQPDTQKFLEKLKKQQEAKLNAQENDNRPFVLKYWKYILPIVIIFILQSAFANDAGGQGGGAGGQ